MNTFITDHLDGAENVWAGGMSVDYPSGYGGNTGIKRVWTWQFGPLAGTIFTECSNIAASCSHTNDTGDYYDWNPGEPNNSGYSGPGTGEHYVEINYLGAGHWNDIPNSTSIDGYVVEFGNDVTGGHFTGSYSASSNVTLAAAPGTPTAVQGTRGNGQVTVSWTAPADNNEPITGYTVTAEAGRRDLHIHEHDVVRRRGPRQRHELRLHGHRHQRHRHRQRVERDRRHARQRSRCSCSSAKSRRATTRRPSHWAAPSDGGAAISGYTVTASPGGATCTTTTATSCAVVGLSNGVAYTFTVTATNDVGTSGPSGVSSSVTPATVPNAPTDATASGGNGGARYGVVDRPGLELGAAIT